MNTSEEPMASTTASVLLLTLFALTCSAALNLAALNVATAARPGPPVAGAPGADAHTQKSSGTLLVGKNGVQLNTLSGDQSGNSGEEKQEAAEESIAKIALSRL